MILWRISNYASLDGRGGLIASARWHTAGRPVVYLAETPTGALTEILVHLEVQASQFPKTYKLLKVEVPSEAAISVISETKLTLSWRHNPSVTRRIGDDWLRMGKTALLRVPSAIAPETWNVLLNPRHPDAAAIKVLWQQEHPWDVRLLRMLRKRI
jgi:RES domain-containing protein